MTQPNNTNTMKTAISAPAPDEGKGGGSGGAAVPTPESMMQEAIKHAKAHQAGASEGPHYGQATYGQAYYPTVDPDVPVSDGARVKMDLARRNNDNLKSYVANNILQMDGNLNFPTPMPAAASFLTTFTTFDTALTTWVAAKTALRDASTALEAGRAAMIEAMQTRGTYVQTASNGNANVIASSGLDLRNPPSPVGQLPAPTDLTAILNHTAGLVRLTWSPVSRARGYVLECSPDVQPRAFTLLANTTKANAEKQLATGETYVFRVAASGGSTGQSYYSPEVIRGAA